MSDAAAAPEKPDVDLAAAGLAAKPSKLVPIALVVNSLLVAAVLARSFLAPAAEPAAAHEQEPKAEHGEHAAAAGPSLGLGPTVRLPEFVVHLRNPEAERYAKVTFEVEVGVEADKDKVNAVMPKIRELFISYLADRTTEDLRGSEGIEHTKRDLLARLSQALPGSPIRAVYITDIVVQ